MNLGNYSSTIDDANEALGLKPLYLKALHRRAVARENLEYLRLALTDFTACAIIENFTEQRTGKDVDRVLKALSTKAAHEVFKTKAPMMPSDFFISAYIESFRRKPVPTDLEGSEQEGDVAMKRGYEHLKDKNYEESFAAFQSAVDSNCNHMAIALNWTGTFKYLMGLVTEAQEDYDRSIEIDPNFIETYLKRNNVHLELRDPEATEAGFAKTLDIDATDSDIYYHRGQVHMLHLETELAIKDYEKTIELDKSFSHAHIQLGIAQYKAGDVTKSMSTFRRCANSFRNTPNVYNYYGEILLDQNKLQEALEKFDTAIQLYTTQRHISPNAVCVVNKALTVRALTDDTEQCVKLLKEAVEREISSYLLLC